MTPLLAALQGPTVDWFSLSPLLVLLGGALFLLMVGALTPAWPKGLYALFTVAVSVATFVLGVVLWHQIDREGPSTLVGNALQLDKPTVWLVFIVAGALAVTSLLTDGYLRREGLDGPEVYGLYLLAAIGGIVMGSANDLVVLFLGLEILSIALYVLAASHRRRVSSQESGMKYFVLGSFSSAIFLYGVALLYGGSGSTNYAEIVAAFNQAIELDRSHDALVLAGVALVVVGLSFKAAAVPFHFWTPDVYQGAPTPVTAFMSSVAKAAAFVAMLRVLVEALGHWSDDYQPVIWVVGVLTLLVGSAMAVVQTDVKRMLAFSSISHAGFILVGIEAAVHTPGAPMAGDGVNAVLLYTAIYAVMTLGSFGVVTAVSRTGDAATDISAFRGLGRNRTWLAIGMTILLLAQAGVPLTAGFVAKFGVITAAVDVESYVIAVIAMLAAVIAAYLYLRIMVSMWVTDPEASDEAREPVRVPALLGIAVTLTVAFTLAVGLYPGLLLDALP